MTSWFTGPGSAPEPARGWKPAHSSSRVSGCRPVPCLPGVWAEDVIGRSLALWKEGTAVPGGRPHLPQSDTSSANAVCVRVDVQASRRRKSPSSAVGKRLEGRRDGHRPGGSDRGQEPPPSSQEEAPVTALIPPPPRPHRPHRPQASGFWDTRGQVLSSQPHAGEGAPREPPCPGARGCPPVACLWPALRSSSPPTLLAEPSPGLRGFINMWEEQWVGSLRSGSRL